MQRDLHKEMKRTVNPALKTKPKMAHYVLRAANLHRSIDWYSAVLEMHVVYRNEHLCFLTYDDEHHRLALAQTPVADLPPRGSPGLDHVAYTLESLEELLATYRRLKGLDILPAWPINHGLTTSLYYEDPDGNRVEFQVDNFATKDELNAFLYSDSFAENPIGVTFDPEILLSRYENGDAIEELIKQGSAS
ncbi:MAG: VOC family protein [Pseudomonadota bacterium]